MLSLTEVANILRSVSDTPMLDARLLMKHAGSDDQKLHDALTRRLSHEPVSKIIGHRGFWKSDFITSADVLDPRPDSETIIEAVLKTYPDTSQPHHILDIGVGSGCLLFSLLDEYPLARGTGIDKEQSALNIAYQNREKRHAELKRIDFNTSDWGVSLGTFDIIISNPPYIPTTDLAGLSPDVRKYDPISALDGGSDGLDAYRALARSIKTVLAPNGHLFLEIGIGRGQQVRALFEKAGLRFIRSDKDLAGIDRVLIFRY